MESSPPASPQPNVLKNILDDAEAELRRRLHEACEAEAKGVSTESSAEIRRLEDSLLAAAVAAEQTITMRRHLGEQEQAPAPGERARKSVPAVERKEQPIVVRPAAPLPTRQPAEHEQRATDVREFRDTAGHPWRAWPVVPGLSRASAAGRSFLGDFQNGWICFESLDSPGRRRLPAPQPDWSAISEDDLRGLLAQAIDAPERANQPKDKT